jgi:hypothetical protein
MGNNSSDDLILSKIGKTRGNLPDWGKSNSVTNETGDKKIQPDITGNPGINNGSSPPHGLF